MPRKLRAVGADEPVQVVPKSIKDAAAMGERALLVAMRTKAASEIDAGVPPAYLAPLMRQLRELDKEIRLMDSRDEQEGTNAPTADEVWTAI